MFFAIQDRIGDQAHLSDLNQHLVNAWAAVRDEPAALRPLLALHKERDCKEYYYEMRAMAPSDPIEQAARFLYLNGTSWNHLWRENSKTGAMNTPWGDRSFKSFTDSELLAIRNSLSIARIHHEDFRDALRRPVKGDFVYLDPPYLPVFTNPEEKEPTSKFNKYTAKVFGRPELDELVEICSDLTQRGVNWIMSNRDTPEVRSLFPDSEFIGFTTHRSLAAQSKRAVEARRSPEAIIIGG